MNAMPPVRIQVQFGPYIGTTAFFRNRAFLAQLGQEAAVLSEDGRTLQILVHAGSAGAEAYSLAIHLALRHPKLAFQIASTDISPELCDIARGAVYPAETLTALTSEERAHFTPTPDGSLGVTPDIKSKVDILAASSFVDFEALKSYDIVLVSNALCYVVAEDQARTIDAIGRYNTGVLCVTAFHATSIAADLKRNGYQPVTAGIKDIHAGWTDRHFPSGASVRLPKTVKTNPYLVPIDNGPDWEYRHGAIFKKSTAVAANIP